MQQRSSSSSRCSSDEFRAINVSADQQQHTKRRRIFEEDSLDELPIYHRSVTGRRDNSRSRSPPAEKCIHLIPVVVMLCLFTLWWFSFPVNLEIKDGRITAIRQIHAPLPNNTRIDLTMLAVAASSPIPANNPPNLSGEDETYLHPASSPK
ncbi:hypothetical protein DEO72_LG3g2832 [Vigna unguiculata]|uniref:Transmembrane protein n=1 Tax=Vigna unguiculata TaxID=3917 RepID=A0A4D6LIE6_VIGUN|nr:hypothetical protein DEO72_LG3g2832 [Vigna unguiculata]